MPIWRGVFGNRSVNADFDPASGFLGVNGVYRSMDRQITKPDGVVRAIRFSTAAFPERNRAAMWRETLRNQIVSLDAVSLSDDPRIDAVGLALPGLGVVACSATPARVTRTREIMRDGNDNIRLVILKQAASSAPATHLGRDLTVEPGSAVVLSNCDFNAITFTAQSRYLAINFTRPTLRPLLRDFDTAVAHTIPNQVGALRLLASYVEALLADPVPPTDELRQLAIAHIYDLGALAMGATRDTAELANKRGLRAARLREIKSDIAANLWRDGLSVGGIAMRQRVTSRYVQMLFEEEGTTFTEFVLAARLDRAHRMLADPCLTDRSISTVAFDAGFGDLSYFNKSFRRRFGQTPSDVRASSARYASIRT
jgi:AraC-like DNA-binding protein